MLVRDAIGRDWRVELPFLPWRRVVKPFFLFADEKLQQRESVAGMYVDTRTADQRARAERLAALEADKANKANEPLTVGEKVAVGAFAVADMSLPW